MTSGEGESVKQEHWRVREAEAVASSGKEGALGMVSQASDDLGLALDQALVQVLDLYPRPVYASLCRVGNLPKESSKNRQALPVRGGDEDTESLSQPLPMGKSEPSGLSPSSL